MAGRSLSDMLRETCPEDLSEIDAPVRRQPPSALALFGPPLLLCAVAVLVAWLHTALGSPFGPAWASEVWGMAKVAIAATVPALAFGAYARQKNEHNLRVLQARQEAEARAGISASSVARVRQTGPHRTLTSGRPPARPTTGRQHRLVIPEVVEDEEDERW